MQKQQAGFTLIELVIVIVILGILASFAVPRFADTAKDARAATVKALQGSMKSAAAMAKGAVLARNGLHNTPISVEGQTVTMNYFYPTATPGGIGNAIGDLSGFSVTTSTANSITYSKDNVATAANCAVTYQEPASSNAAPSITVNVTDCS